MVNSAVSETATLASLSSAQVWRLVFVIKHHWHRSYAINYLAKNQVIEITEKPPLGCAVGIVNDNISVHLAVAELVDADSEIAKLQKKKEDTAKYGLSLLICGFFFFSRF